MLPFVVQVFLHLSGANAISNFVVPENDSRAVTKSLTTALILESQPDVTTYPNPPSLGSVTTNDHTDAMSISSDVSHSPSSTSFKSKSVSSVTTRTESISTIPETVKPTTTTKTSSAAATFQMNGALNKILGVYTIVFTLFLLPVPNTSFLELSLISVISVTGWTLLCLDYLVTFFQNPEEQLMSMANSFLVGLIMYLIERWYTFQLIRSRALSYRKYQQEHPTLHSKFRYYPPPSPTRPFRLGAWWKSNILESINSHNSLYDYLGDPQRNPNPVDFVLEKYNHPRHPPVDPSIGGYIGRTGFTPSGTTPIKRPHGDDDLFSSDEDLDTSPFATKDLKVPKYRSASDVADEPVSVVSAGEGIFSSVKVEESKETCVDTGLSPREKVCGFISWDALKRDSEKAAAVGDEKEVPEIANEMGTQSPVTTQSGWEKEMLGAAI